MKSRTYQTCERILKNLIQTYGPTARIGELLINLAIKEEAGGDSRTMRHYREDLVSLNFLIVNRDATFSFNLKKVDYKQLELQESLLISDDKPP